MLLNEELEKQTVFRNKLFLSIAKTISSFEKVPEVVPTTEGALNVITERLFNVHGKFLVSHVLGLLSASRNGFSEADLIEMLSADDKVLDDIFQYHQPPLRRLPELVMKRLLMEIQQYICKPHVNGKQVIRYFHRQFHQYFKRFRSVELYQLALRYLNGELKTEYKVKSLKKTRK